MKGGGEEKEEEETQQYNTGECNSVAVVYKAVMTQCVTDAIINNAEIHGMCLSPTDETVKYVSQLLIW